VVTDQTPFCSTYHPLTDEPLPRRSEERTVGGPVALPERCLLNQGGASMYARSTTFQAQPRTIDAGIDFLREQVVPAVQEMDGCLGMSMMVDRKSGRCIATTAWESMDLMRASDSAVMPLREQAGKILRGSPFVEEWEIAVLHRDHNSKPGACVRSTWMHGAPAQIDKGIDTFRMATLPALEHLEGFCSASMFIDRANGRMVTSASYDNADLMTMNRNAATTLRLAAASDAGMDILDVAEFELLMAHLRVPEMA